MKHLLLAIFLALLLLAHPPRLVAAASSCHFFTEAGGYYVCDDAQARFLSAFQRWGPQKIGYPISRRYEQDGFVTQAFQKAIMQWRADSGTVVLVNIFDELSRRGFDQRLLDSRQTPAPLPAGWDGAGLAFQQIVQKRQALLATRPALHAAYLASGDPLTFFGLPTSPITDMGNHYAVRLQRAVLQEWKEDVPWARRGQVTIANGGDIARELGALPESALLAESSAAAPASPSSDTLGNQQGGAGSATPPDDAQARFDATAREIDSFWSAQFASSGQGYRPPQVIAYGQEGIRTPCGFVDGDNAAYCAGARTIYYDATFLAALQEQAGEIAPRTVLAHEWGHHIQYELRLVQPTALARELQADCLAGAYTSHLGQGTLSDAEKQAVANLLLLVGDPEELPADDPYTHGSGEQRQRAFLRGAEQGMAGCVGEATFP